MNRILSGIQPTGNLHLGNYLGAIRNWVRMQADDECLFMLADLHAITVPQDPAALQAATRETAAVYIACGIDPQRSVIFPQSAIAAHSELAWILNCHTPMGWLFRMAQFKDKAPIKKAELIDGKLELVFKEQQNLGLLSYPVLQAADILIYQATHVPVGEDQKQHIELARDIAGAFNRAYDTEFFTLPEPVIQKSAARIMSLRDGSKKMSKSDESDYSRINLTDDADMIAKKLKKATSDSQHGITYEPQTRPEAANLLQIFAALTDRSVEAVQAEYADSPFSTFKQHLAAAAVEHLAPIAARTRELLDDPGQLDAILKHNTERAAEMAGATLAAVRKQVGFIAL